MASFKCPACGKGRMETQIVPNFETQFEGFTIQVKDAEISQCTHCGEQSYGAQELQRWKEIKLAKLAELNQIPSADVVKWVREHRGLSVSDFASLLGVTRQTVHSWERAEGGGMRFGPAAMLVCLLNSESHDDADHVFSYLVRLARERGQLLGVLLPRSDDRKPDNPQVASRLLRLHPSAAPGFCNPAANASTQSQKARTCL